MQMNHTSHIPFEQEYAAPTTAPDARSDFTPGQIGAAYLKQLDQDGVHQLVAIDPSRGALKGKTFQVGEFDAVAAWVDSLAGAWNLYFTLNEVRSTFAGTKPTKEDIVKIRGIGVDVDPPAGSEADVEVARAEIREILMSFASPRFTSIWDTGGGYQAVLLVDQKIDATSDTVGWAEEHGRGLAHLLGGDSTHNIERLYRLPGPDNIPTPAKAANGRVRRAANVVRWDGDRVAPATISQEIVPLHAPVGSEERDDEISEVQRDLATSGYECCSNYAELPEELRSRFDADLEKNAGLRRLWHEGHLKSADKTGSAYRFSLAGWLKRVGGYSADDFASLANVWDFAVQLGDDRDAKLTPRALARDWARSGGDPSPHADARPEDHFEAIAADVWTDPIDIFAETPLSEMSALPDGVLSPELAKWVSSESRRKGVSPIFAASAAIAAVAGAVGNGLRLQPRLKDTEWSVPCSLWMVLVDNPGGGKSPIINAALKPLRELDNKRWATARPEIERWEAANRGRKKSGTPRPVATRTLVDDVTMEKLVMLSAENPRGLLQAPDELTQALGQFGAYKNNGGGGDRSQYLRFYDGGSISVDRVGSGARRTENALMGILAGSQPDRLGKMVRDLGDDGLLQRFVFIVGDEIDRAGGEDLAPDADAISGYCEMLRGLAQAELGGAVVKMSDPAHQVFERARLAMRDLAHLPGASVAWQGHVAKWGGTLARLVLAFHAIELWRCYRVTGTWGTDCPVETDTATRAVAFAKLLIRHCYSFYDRNFDPAPTEKAARSFAGYLLAHPEMKDFGKRDVGQAQKALRDDRLRGPALKNLEAMGWIRPAERDANGPSHWEVNSVIHRRFAERAVWEAEERARKRVAIERAGAARREILAGANNQQEAF